MLKQKIDTAALFAQKKIRSSKQRAHFADT